MVAWFDVREDERRLVRPAAALVAAAGAGFALVSSASDALFLTKVGFRHLGTVFAFSSALLIVVLGYLGAVADRADRGRLLTGVAIAAALVLAALAAALPAAPGTVAGASLVLGKQFGAAVDLGFWVLVAERFDARQGRRLVPLFVAANGVGLVIGGFLVGPLAHAIGARGVLACGGAMFAVAALAAHRFARADAARPLPAGAVAVAPRPRAPLRWNASWQAVRRSSLATRLAILVAVAGVFAPILYYLLGVAAVASYGGEADLAQFLGRYRGIVQVLTLATQLLVVPALMARAGVATALIVAPLGAVAAAIALAAHPVLMVVVIAQASARLLDTAVQTPAEKLSQNLMARQVRGRIAGFLDGVAKRAGAIAGGLLASALVVFPKALAVATVVVALAWLGAAIALRRKFADLAVDELVERRSEHRDEDWAEALVDERSLDQLRASLTADGERRALAIDLIIQLGARGRLDPADELARAAKDAQGRARGALLVALERYLADRAPGGTIGGADALLAIRADGDREDVARAIRCLGYITGSGAGAGAGAGAATGAGAGAEAGAGAGVETGVIAFVTRVASARFRGDHVGLDELIDEGLDDPELRSAALDELQLELGALSRAASFDSERALDRSRAMVRVLRRHRGRGAERGLALVARVIGRATDVSPGAELLLLRADARDLAMRVLDESDPALDRLRAAAVELLGHIADAESNRALARALGDRDDDVRRAASSALERLGPDALEVLLLAARYGRRQARNGALEVLRDLRITSAALDELIDAELAELDRTTARLHAVSELADAPIVRRLEERLDEVAHTLFLILEVRLAEPAIGAASRQFLRAREPVTRARALETLDTVLPRPLAARVLERLDDAPLHMRSSAAADRLGQPPPDVDTAVREELAGNDSIARDLIVHALDASGLASHREAITTAAAEAAQTLDPMAMLRRLSEDATQVEEDMPRSVETMMALSQIPIFAELTSRQVAELAAVVRWQSVSAGHTIVDEGETGDAMYFVHSGRVRVQTQRGAEAKSLGTLESGEPFGEMALFEGEPRSATVVAETKTRLGRIDRVEFEDLVDDVPGIALAICRVLSRRVRKLNAAMTG